MMALWAHPGVDGLADYLQNGGKRGDGRALSLQCRLCWLVSFSPRLRPSGPWIQFADGPW